jgi:NADH:ubiquinone oxidoreductase subunit F (NADH-binding)
VSGAVVRPGVVEAPTGTSVGALLRMAGGPSEPVQAILTGGYGGTWLPPALLEVPATPSLLARAGATLGPGIVIALPAPAARRPGACCPRVTDPVRPVAW